MRHVCAVVVDGQHGSRRNALPVSCLPTNRKLTSTTDEATVSSPPILFPASFLQKRGRIIDVRSHPALAFGEAAPVGEGRKQPDWSVESPLLRHRRNQSRMFGGEMAEGLLTYRYLNTILAIIPLSS
jgi:hypothetical protein